MTILAHRGGVPNNCLSAIKQLIEDGIEGIEVDVYLTSDNVPILFHGGHYGEIGKSIPHLGVTPETKIRELTIDQVEQIEIAPEEYAP